MPARQQTLRAAIEWSYELLDENEKELFSQLSVFAGGWTLDAVETVCDHGFDALASLIDRNLIRRRGERFASLETIREYATDVLEGSGGADEFRRRHAEFYLGLVQRDDPRVTPPRIATLVAAEYDNLCTALTWALREAPELALRLASMLFSSWAERGMLGEGRRWLIEALRKAPVDSSSARARSLAGAAWLAYLAGDLDDGKRLGEPALFVAREIDDPRIMVTALNILGSCDLSAGQSDYARRFFEEGEVIARRHDDKLGLAASLGNLGAIALHHREWETSIRHFHAALSVGITWPRTGPLLLSMGLAELQAGRELTGVAVRFEEVFRCASERGDGLYAAGALWGLGLTAAKAGCGEAGATVLAAAAQEREAVGHGLDGFERALQEEAIERLHVHLDDETFASAWADGSRLSPAAAFAVGLEAITHV